MNASSRPFASPDSMPPHRREPAPTPPAADPHDEPLVTADEASSLACALSGVIVGVTAGAAIALAMARGEPDERTVFGAVIGVVFGLIAGRKIAACQTVLGGTLFAMFVPLALMIGHAVRSGRVGDIGRDIGDPRFHLFMLIVFGGAGVIGAALVALRKLIERMAR